MCFTLNTALSARHEANVSRFLGRVNINYSHAIKSNHGNAIWSIGSQITKSLAEYYHAAAYEPERRQLRSTSKVTTKRGASIVNMLLKPAKMRANLWLQYQLVCICLSTSYTLLVFQRRFIFKRKVMKNIFLFPTICRWHFIPN